jgi:hypothetical protein
MSIISNTFAASRVLDALSDKYRVLKKKEGKDRQRVVFSMIQYVQYRYISKCYVLVALMRIESEIESFKAEIERQGKLHAYYNDSP